MLKIVCLLLLFMGSCIMLASIIVYTNTMKIYKGFISSSEKFSNAAIFVMMSFFLLGYIATFFYIFSLDDVNISLLLIAIIFFFGAIFCFSVVYVQARLLSRLEKNSLVIQKALDESTVANTALTELNGELVTTMETLKQAQDQLVFSEKMSTLGKLMAGVSHEINTPLGVIKASAQNLQALASERLISIFSDVRKLSEDDFDNFIKLAEIAKENSKLFTSTSQLRALKREAQRVLSEENGFNNTIMHLLVSCALLDSGSIEHIKHHLKSETFEQVLNLVNKTVSINTSINNIHHSSEKVIKLSSSLKSFSHISSQSEKTSFSVTAGIEVVLSIYSNKLKYNVEVNTDFEDVDNIIGYEDELSQVWSNLIENAIYAMGENNKDEPITNKLSISVKASSSNITVSISDNGKGMEPDKIKNIFEPFYTTKPVGIGSGLGLSISKQIIDKHNGDIIVDSRLGHGTTFTIILPV